MKYTIQEQITGAFLVRVHDGPRNYWVRAPDMEPSRVTQKNISLDPGTQPPRLNTRDPVLLKRWACWAIDNLIEQRAFESRELYTFSAEYP